MKLFHHSTAAAVVAVVALSATAFVGCKPSEKSYKQAYDKVIAHQTETGNDGLEGTVYNRFREAAGERTLVTSAGDTITVRVQNIGFPADGGGSRDSTLTYNVVVGGFKQIFNAKALRDRMRALGYKSFIVNTAEPLYYVVAATVSTPEEAAEQLRRVSSQSGYTPAREYPIILQPSFRR